MSPGGLPLASFVDRLLAYLIDGAVFFAVSLVFIFPPFLALILASQPDALAEEANPFEFILFVLLLDAALFAVMLVLAYLYYVEFMRRSGQTLGKKAMKIRVVPLDPAAALSRQDYFKRYVVQVIGGAFVPFFSYVDGLWQLWDKPYQQCLHDKYARTVVVKVPAP